MLIRSQLAAQMSGSLSGVTAARNAAGQYLRARSVPVNPNSPAQVAARSALATVVAAWAALTDGVRANWKTYADAIPWKNAIGDDITLSAQQMYTACQTARTRAALPLVADAPTVLSLPTFTTPTYTISEGAIPDVEVAFTNTDDWAGEVGGAMLIQVSDALPPTINYFKGPFRYIGKIAGAGTPPTSPVTMAHFSTNLAQGNIVFARASIVRADGRLSGSVISRITIAA